MNSQLRRSDMFIETPIQNHQAPAERHVYHSFKHDAIGGHAAPLGLGKFLGCLFYKHVAPTALSRPLSESTSGILA